MKVASSHHDSNPKVAAKPPSPAVAPLIQVDTDGPAVQKGKAVVTSAKYGALRHPTADGAIVHVDTEVSNTWQKSDNQVLIDICARHIPLPVLCLLNRPNHVRLECRKLEANCITVSGWTTFVRRTVVCSL